MNMDWDDICADVIAYFSEVPDELTDIARELDCYNNFLADNDEVNEYMDYLDDMYWDRALDLINDGLYGHDEEGGDFNLDREYFYYDAYGRLVSTDDHYQSDNYTCYLDDDFVKDLYEYREELEDYLPRYIYRLFKYWKSSGEEE